MEQVRLLTAIGLSFLVLFVWNVFFTNDLEVNNSESASFVEKTVPTTSRTDSQQNTTENSALQTQEVNTFTSDSSYKPKDIVVDTPLFRVMISERGGLIKSVKLKHYREESVPNSGFKELVTEQFSCGNALTYFSGDTVSKIENAVFKTNLETSYLQVNDEARTLHFTLIDAKGKSLVKTFRFDPDSYLVNMEVSVKNNSDYVISDSLILSLKNREPGKTGYSFEGPSLFIDGQLEQIKVKKIDGIKTYDGHIDWIAIEDRYFISSVIPSHDSKWHMELDVKNNLIENKIISAPFQLYPNQQMRFEASLFMGPKSVEILSRVGHNMEKAVYFGMFDFIAKPCLWFMNKLYCILPNYGISIILLTVFTKLLLWPLGSKGYKSMSEMKKLQPLMAEIRTRYKNDKRKMNQEIMALYRTYKVNPVGGCLPMILQIPVFFALYRMLYQAIELRHAPFIFWIKDLSAPDRLFNFSFSIPFMQPPYGIPVLTIVMGATMLLQQKMSPPPGDPSQAKVMMFMPVVFTFIFINFSSGLVLYWLVNNIISISQQYYIQKKTI